MLNYISLPFRLLARQQLQTRLMVAIFLLLATGQTAFAQGGGLAGMFNRGTETANAAGQFAEAVIIIAGLIAAAWGIWSLTMGKQSRDQQQKGSMVPLLAILGGVALSAIVFTMGTVSTTLLGSDEVAQDFTNF